MNFQIRDKHLKKYPHFDKPILPEELLAIVTDPEAVRKNAFFPFLEYTKKHKPFRKSSAKQEIKRRLIRYASRRDAAIYSYYRHVLSERYEIRLSELGLQDVPIAYRKITNEETPGRGKCNIDFAHDVFCEVLRQRDCVVITLDISKYFDCIDHHRLRRVWCDLLGVDTLPPDHFAVFKSITKYSVVDRVAAYERLGIVGNREQADGTIEKGYLRPFNAMPRQLCVPAVFREKIIGEGAGYSSLLTTNNQQFGIPQGAPISDLLANAYLLEFDRSVSAYAQSKEGRYWRYSDDIILVLPGGESVGHDAHDYINDEITKHGDRLEIKAAKTSIVEFSGADGEDLVFRPVSGGHTNNGLEYLGFRFDGKKVYLRDATMANFYRKITWRARRQARKHIARYKGKSIDWLMGNFDFADFEKRFGRVRDFETVSTKKGWTFWTYAKRASERFGNRGASIFRQVRGYRRYIRHAVEMEMTRKLMG